MRFALPFVALSLLTITVGCAPLTEYRRSALVPSVARAVQTAPIHGVAEIGGSAAVENVYTDPVPERGDPAMRVPELELEAYARFRVGPFGIGAHGRVAWLDVNEETAFDMPPVPEETVWGFGPDVSFAHRFDGSILGIGGGASFTLAQVPWSTWQRDDFTGTYMLIESDVETHVLYRLAVALHLYPVERLLLETGLMVQNHLRNVGFDDAQQEGSTLSTDVHGVVPYFGVRYQDPSGFFAQAQVQFPLGFDEANVEPFAGTFSVGVAFGAPPEEEEIVEPPTYAPSPAAAPTHAPALAPATDKK